MNRPEMVLNDIKLKNLTRIIGSTIEQGMSPHSRAVHKVAMVMLVVICGFLAGLFFAGFNEWYYMIPGVVLYCGGLYINYQKQPVAAKNLMHYGTIILITFWSFANRRSGAEYGLIGLACFAPTIFESRKNILLSFSLVLTLFICYVVYDQLTPFVPNPTINHEALSRIILVVVIFIVFFQLMNFRNTTSSFANTLKEKNSQLAVTIQNKEKVESELQNRNEELQTLTDQLNWIVKQKTAELQVYTDAINFSIYYSIIDLTGTFIKVNDPFLEATGYTEQELVGNSIRALESGFHSNDFFHSLNAALEKGQAWRGETKGKSKDGSIFWSDQIITPIKTMGGSVSYYLLLGLPITERKLSEEAREKTFNFIETIAHQTSHKVRGPVARIHGLVNLLQLGMIDPSELVMVTEKLKESSMEVNQATTDLVNFINDNRYSVAPHFKQK